MSLIKKYFKLLKNKLKGTNDSLTNYEKILLVIDELDSDNFINFNRKENSLLLIRSIYKNIPTYNSKLKEIIGYLSKDKVIYNGWCLENECVLYVNEFFISNDHQYIEENNYIKEFKLLAIVYLSFYYEHSPLVEMGEHNCRVLSNFTDGLINTIEDLVSITKT